jgi:Zn-dependent protease
MAAGNDVEARTAWQGALRLLPPDAEQSAVIEGRVRELSARIDASTVATSKRATDTAPWWRRGIAGLATAIFLLLGKLKFLLLGLTKLSTFVSMFAFFGVYWGLYGWPLALGLVVSIYIHEMGHVAMLKRLGIAAGAPVFIPGLGALVLLKQHVDDPVADAKIGLAGPVWGLGAALVAFGVFEVTHAPIWMAVAQLGGFVNLFNLVPVWQLDGSRGFHALSRQERWVVVAVIVVLLWLTELRFLFILGGVAVYRAWQREVGPGNRGVLVTFAVLLAALAWLAKDIP